MDGDYVNVTGTASGNITLSNLVYTNKTIFDFSNTNFSTYNLQIEGCENLVLHKPSIDMGGDSGSSITVSTSKKIIIDKADIVNGNNGVKLTHDASECFIYQSTAHLANTDAFTCHNNVSGETGNRNVFYDCKGSGDEEAFDITSGQDHYVINCSGKTTNGTKALIVGHGSSVTIINFKAPDYELSLKDTSYVNIVDLQIDSLLFESQAGDLTLIPDNVVLYGAEPTIDNSESLDTSFYTKSNDNFINPIQSYIDNTIKWIHDNLR